MTSHRQSGSEGKTPESPRQPVSKLYSLPHIRLSRYLGFSASRREARAWFQCSTAQKAPRAATPAERKSTGTATPAQEELEPQASTTLPADRSGEFRRWPILRSILSSGPDPDPAPGPGAASAYAETRPVPAVLVFSFAGGVGKSTITATLARTLAARGERVLALDASSRGLLPFAFGSKELKHGTLRTFGPPSSEPGAPKPCTPVQTITLDPAERAAGTDSPAKTIRKLLLGQTVPPDRILIDAPTANERIAASMLTLEPVILELAILVPLLPDAHSAADVRSIEAFFSSCSGSGTAAGPFYLLNQFDPARPSHIFAREALDATLGDRLLPFAIPRDTAIPDAMAEGMTILDYAPESQAAEGYRKLADWLRAASPRTSAWSRRRWIEQ